MAQEIKFYVCKKCGNLVGMVHDSNVTMICCGQEMVELKPNTVEAAKEKHLPVISVSGTIATVKIGAVEHPMTAEHSILWVYLETAKRRPAEKPQSGG